MEKIDKKDHSSAKRDLNFLFLKPISIAEIIKMLFLSVGGSFGIFNLFFHIYNLLGIKEWFELIEFSIVYKNLCDLIQY
jgi:hypothetical protein